MILKTQFSSKVDLTGFGNELFNYCTWLVSSYVKNTDVKSYMYTTLGFLKVRLFISPVNLTFEICRLKQFHHVQNNVPNFLKYFIHCFLICSRPKPSQYTEVISCLLSSYPALKNGLVGQDAMVCS